MNPAALAYVSRGKLRLASDRLMLTRLALALMWLLRLLPLPLLAAIGDGFGTLLYALGRERRRICLVNLARCLPELSAG